jgi:hypothetical protein
MGGKPAWHFHHSGEGDDEFQNREGDLQGAAPGASLFARANGRFAALRGIDPFELYIDDGIYRAGLFYGIRQARPRCSITSIGWIGRKVYGTEADRGTGIG